MIVDDITDGGFFEATSLLSGRYLSIRRDAVVVYGNNYNLFCLKAFQTPNLIKVYESSISITSDTTTAVTNHEAINLIQNLEHRHSVAATKAVTVSNPLARLTQYTCFKAEYLVIKAQSNQVVIGFDFTEPVFMHAVLWAQDVLSGGFPANLGPSDSKNFFQKYEVYIGNSADYLENTKCAGGPHLDYNDSSSYVFSQKGFNDSMDPFSEGLGMVWPSGQELWCNLEGQYMHMVADQSDQVGSAADSDTVTMCQVGVYGTKYERTSGDPVPATIEVSQGQSETVTIDNIQASIPIGNTLAINLR